MTDKALEKLNKQMGIVGDILNKYEMAEQDREEVSAIYDIILENLEG